MSRKGENIYKRKDGRWEGRYIKCRTSEGKATYGYVYAKTYREVRAKLFNQVTLVNHVSGPENNTMPEKSSDLLEDIATEWFQMIVSQVKESTSNKYGNLLKSYIYPNFAAIPLNKMTYDCIESKCNELLISGGVKGTGLSPKTVSDILSVIRNILHFAVKKGKMVPCDAQSIHVKNNFKEMCVLSRGEQEKLCQYLYSNLDGANIGILVCLFTGLRIGEICALRWEDISLSEQLIHVHGTLQRVQDRSNGEKKTKVIITEPKSACSIRKIPISDELVRIMESHKTTSTGYFLTNSNQHFLEPRTMQNHFKQALKKSLVSPVNFHALRHTFATRCIELGFDVKSLSEILGHASVNITMNRYVHPSMELKRENIKKLSALFSVKENGQEKEDD